MSFEAIKKHFQRKYEQDEQKKPDFYVVKEIGDSVYHIVEDKILETMLISNQSFNELGGAGFVCSVENHQGKDHQTYETHKLTQTGQSFYKKILKNHNIKDGSKYVDAFFEQRLNKNPLHLKKEKQQLKDFENKKGIQYVFFYQKREFSQGIELK